MSVRTQSGITTELRDRMNRQSLEARDQGIARLRSISTELRQMAAAPAGTSEMAHDIARQAADRIDAFCDAAESYQPNEIARQIRWYANEHPVSTSAGFFAAGLLVGRTIRGARSASHQPSIDLRDQHSLPSSVPDVGYIS